MRPITNMDMLLNKSMDFPLNFETSERIESSDSSSDEEIEEEFRRRRAAQDKKNKTSFAFSKLKFKSAKNNSHLHKVEETTLRQVHKTPNLPQLKVTGNILVSEGISHVHPPKFEHYSSKSSKNSIPLDWITFSPKMVKKRPNTVLNSLNKPTITISDRDISETEKELRAIQQERALMFSNQKTPDWAKGVSSMLAAPSRSTMRTSIISNTMKANDFLI